jgi:hypothetical protein
MRGLASVLGAGEKQLQLLDRILRIGRISGSGPWRIHTTSDPASFLYLFFQKQLQRFCLIRKSVQLSVQSGQSSCRCSCSYGAQPPHRSLV